MKQFLTVLILLVCSSSIAFSQCEDNSCECVYCLSIDDDILWIGTKAGLIRYDLANETRTIYNTENSGLPDNLVCALLPDADNTLWIGTYNGGLVKFRDNTWEQFSTSNSGIASNMIVNITTFHDTILWMASGAGVQTYDGQNWGQYNQDNSSLTYDQVYDVTNEGDSVMWISANGGLSKYNGEWYQYTTLNSGLPHSVVYTTELIGDTKYVGTMGGLVTFNGISWDNEFSEKTLVVRNENAPGYIWAGTNVGLKLNDLEWDTTFTEAISNLGSSLIQDIAIDKNGNKWIATWGAGVYRFDNNDFYKLDLLTDISPSEAEQPVVAYPNPVRDQLKISLNAPVTKLELLDVQGRIFSSITPDRHDNVVLLDISQLNSGLLFLQTYTAGGIQVQKIIKQ